MPRKCIFENCNKIASFNFENEKKPKFCSFHKEYGMINVRQDKCIFENCYKISNFNFENETKGIYCSCHKENGMINIKSKKCLFENCYKEPQYNFKGEKIGKFCLKHKQEGMINIKNNKCIFEGCNIQACFNYLENSKPIFCLKHKEEGIINIISKKCLFEGCNITPSYNYKGERTGKFCVNHKKNEMIDVLCKKCLFEGCNIRPNYNFEGETKPIYCTSHKEKGMIDIIHPICKANKEGILCNTLGNKKYNYYCARCFAYLFPNDPLTFNIKQKTYELKVRDFLNKEFPNIFNHNKVINIGGCSCNHKRFIDFHTIINNILLAIEVDENKHKGYDEEDEEARKNDIMMVYTTPHIFIRFSPNGKYIKNNISCNEPLNKRLEILKNLIEEQLNLIKNNKIDYNNNLLREIYLFY